MARTITLIGGRGGRYELACSTSAADYHLGVSPGLWGLPPHAVISTVAGVIPGERVESVRPLPSFVSVPMTIVGTSPDDLDEKLRGLGGILAPDNPVRIQFTRPGGTREITARYYSGAETIGVRDHKSVSVKLPVLFKAHTPFWRDVSADDPEITEVFVDAQVSGSNPLDIVNDGDVADTWPEFIINGPIENVHLMHLDRGQLVRVIEVLGVGDQIRIITDPRRRDVLFNGVRSWASIDARSTFWALGPGQNRVMLRGSDLSGSGPGDFIVRWSPRFLTC